MIAGFSAASESPSLERVCQMNRNVIIKRIGTLALLTPYAFAQSEQTTKPPKKVRTNDDLVTPSATSVRGRDKSGVRPSAWLDVGNSNVRSVREKYQSLPI